jgi:hypothetical protein
MLTGKAVAHACAAQTFSYLRDDRIGWVHAQNTFIYIYQLMYRINMVSGTEWFALLVLLAAVGAGRHRCRSSDAKKGKE